MAERAALMAARGGMAGKEDSEGAAPHWEALGIDAEMAARLGLEDLSQSEGMLAQRRVKWLSKLESDPQSKNRDLVWACGLGMVREAEGLLKSGADPNIKPSKGHTPLMRTGGSGSVELIAALIAHGAQVGEVDDREWTALMWACEQGRVAALAPHRDSCVDAVGKDGQMALSLAAGFGAEEAARKMCGSLRLVVRSAKTVTNCDQHSIAGNPANEKDVL